MTIVIVPCPVCQGEGRDIRYGLTREPGCGHVHYGDVDYGPCEECQGSGSVEEDQPARTLADLEQEDFDMIEGALHR
jgi:hypothetical protein